MPVVVDPPVARLLELEPEPGQDTKAPRLGRLATAALWGMVGLGVILVLLAVGVRLSGGNWFIVQTPSMGEAAPVGTLIVTTPTGHTRVQVGEIVTFHPAGAPQDTYTHRVVGIDRTGRIITRGDVNGAQDGWRIPPALVVGRAVAVLPGVGWLIRALLLLLAGGAAVWGATALLRRRDHRLAARFTGLSLVLAAVLAWLRPLLAVTTLQVSATAGSARATVISTGLLPVRVSARGGTAVNLVDGQVGELTTPVPAGGHYVLDVAVHLPFSGWVVLALFCLTPTIVSVALSRTTRPRPAP